MIQKELSTKHVLGIKYLTPQDIQLIFETAESFKEVINRPIKKVPSLRDVTVANLFFENSTRTRISFELAEKRLSADIVNFSASNSSLTKGESLIDTANNILSMKVDMIVGGVDSSQEESNFMNKKKFTKMVEDCVRRESMSYMDTVVYLCEQNNLEIEDVKKYIAISIKEKIEIEAMKLNFLEKSGSL